MERHFTLPIAFAAALHGALLFGFNHTPARSEPPKKERPRIVPFDLPPMPPEELPEPEVVTSDAKRREIPNTPQPVRGEEPPPAPDVVTDFKITPPPIQTAKMTDGNIVPADLPVGISDGKGFGPIFSPGLLDNPPRTRLQAAPLYPLDAKRDGMAGEVHVEFVVDETGAVLDPRVVRSSHRAFEDPSLRAVAKWKFEPGRRDGRIVRFRMVVPVVFNLNE